MKPIEAILYPTDFSECAEKAFQHAAVLAKAFHSKLILFHAVVMYEERVHVPSASRALEKLYESLEEKAHESFPEPDEDVPIERVVARGVSAAEEIVGFAEEREVDLIVMGTHGRGELAQLLLGSVTDRVVRNAKSSVLTTRRDAKDVDPARGYRNLVLAVDFSSHARKAAEWARAIAERFGSEVHFVHVVEDSVHPAYFVTGKTSIFELIPGIRERSRETMRKLAAETGFKPEEVQYRVLEGTPSAEIAEYCEKIDADLLLVGTRGLRGLDYILLGSTAERLVRRAPCAVLVVKEA